MTSTKRKIQQPAVPTVSTAFPDSTVTVRETFYDSMTSLDAEITLLEDSLMDLRARTHNLRSIEETTKNSSEPIHEENTTHLLTRLNRNNSRLRQLRAALDKTALEFDI